jgi:DNA/RNA-binding domain of Phe-tRNA-synthetase-like protein
MAAEASGPDMGRELSLQPGWVASSLAAEFPGLGIAIVEVAGGSRRSPEPVRRRLRDLSDRFFGAQAIHMRERPIPWAYRSFFRQIGLDPDRIRTPVEQLALERLHDGAFKSNGLPTDALTIATLESGIGLRAFDAEGLQGTLGIRESAPEESLAGRRGELPQGTLVIADEKAPVGLLFGATAQSRAVGSDTHRIAIAALRVSGVPQIAIDEALWTAASLIQDS